MKAEHLDFLLELHKTKSLTAASQKLHMSPQALSSAIKALEAELDITLLNRSAKGVSLTAEGDQVVALAKKFFKGLDHIRLTNQAIEPLALSGELAIGVNHNGVGGFLPQLICDLYQDAPSFKLSIQEMTQEQLSEAIATEKVAFGIAYQVNIDGKQLYTLSDDLVFLPILPCKFHCQASKHFPISTYKTVSIKTLLKHPIIYYANNNNHQATTQEIVSFFGKPQNVHFESNLALYKEMIQSGVAITVTLLFPSPNQPEYYVERVSAIPISDNIVAHLGIVSKKNGPMNETAQFLLEYILNYAKGINYTFPNMVP